MKKTYIQLDYIKHGPGEFLRKGVVNSLASESRGSGLFI
jgi:hypothetical protein